MDVFGLPCCVSWYAVDMPLVRCQDCGGRVSKAARSCPHCGRGRNVVGVVGRALRVVTLAGFGVCGVASLAYKNDPEGAAVFMVAAVVFFVMFLCTLVNRLV